MNKRFHDLGMRHFGKQKAGEYSMATLFFDDDIMTDELQDKTICVIGYGSQGNAQANNLRDSGLRVIVGLRTDGASWNRAVQDGFEVHPIEEAVQQADVVHILIPDEIQGKIYQEKIHEHLKPESTLSFSSGFAIHFQKITPPKKCNVILVAPKGPGPAVRSQYLQGSGVPGLFAVHQDFTKTARSVALEIARGCGLARMGVLQTSMQEEIESDLFGEQTILVGGLVELMTAAFDTLRQAGYQDESAYFETVHELKLIVDLIYRQGLSGMLRAVSNTAKFGSMVCGREIVTDETRQTLQSCLQNIRSGAFVKEWDQEYHKGLPALRDYINRIDALPIEQIGKQVRARIHSGQ